MYRREDADSNWVAAVWAAQCEARQRIFLTVDFECAEEFGLYARSFAKRLQKLLNGAASIFDREMLCAGAVHLCRSISGQEAVNESEKDFSMSSWFQSLE